MQIYTETPFTPPIPYGQSMSLNLLILSVYYTKDVDISHPLSTRPSAATLDDIIVPWNVSDFGFLRS